MPLSSLTAKANTGAGTDQLAVLSTASGSAAAVALVDDTGALIGAANPLDVAVIGTATISGTVSATQSGTWTFSNTSFAATQSGTWTVGLSAGANTIGAISNTSFAATQSGTWNVGLNAGVNAIGSITNTSFASTQSGTWTVQPGNTANTTPWLIRPSDGTNSVAVKAASTAAATTDPAVVVSMAGANSAVKIGDGTNNAAVKAASTAAAFTDPALTVDPRPGGALVSASAALADATANPTLGLQTGLNYLFNGSTWDRQRGMSVATTTGDTGAKTATGNGATKTNVGNKGVQIFIILGAVTGTTPTCTFKVQGSVDGTNFFDIPGATTASLTASTNVGIAIYPGIVVTAGTTTTGTTATANGVLPRSWRIVWTIGGTTPSFTITSITYNYITN